MPLESQLRRASASHVSCASVQIKCYIKEEAFPPVATLSVRHHFSDMSQFSVHELSSRSVTFSLICEVVYFGSAIYSLASFWAASSLSRLPLRGTSLSWWLHYYEGGVTKAYVVLHAFDYCDNGYCCDCYLLAAFL